MAIPATTVSTPAVPATAAPGAVSGVAPNQKPYTIGAVCKALAQEFPDISISKIRYLEGQKLLESAPHPGRLPPLQPG